MSEKKQNNEAGPRAITPSEKMHLKEVTKKAKSKADKTPKGTFKEV